MKGEIPVACSNNCSNNCSSGCYGTLNCISGPLTHCGCCSGNSQYFQNYPFYTGPCPAAPCNSCGCSSASNLARRNYLYGGWNSCGGCHSCCATVSEKASGLCSTSAHFIASAPLMAAGGDGLNLIPTENHGHEYYSCTDGGILIRRPGSYMAIYTLHVPALHALSTRLYLSLNGNPLEESAQDVSTISDATTSSYTTHMIFHAFPNSLLRLVTSEDISINPSCEMPAAAKLTLVRL